MEGFAGYMSQQLQDKIMIDVSMMMKQCNIPGVLRQNRKEEGKNFHRVLSPTFAFTHPGLGRASHRQLTASTS